MRRRPERFESVSLKSHRAHRSSGPPALVLALACALPVLVAFAPVASAANSASAPVATSEPGTRQELLDARWPADIVAAADRYVSRYPQGPSAPVARTTLERARLSVRALDRNVRLYRSDFQLAGGPAPIGEEVRQAALADKEAALRIAHAFRDGEAGVSADLNRYVGWLQFSSALGSGPASYELALHYRKADQPALAAPYEARAEELGFKAPSALDNIRK